MASADRSQELQSKIKATALKHALNIEEKKKVADRVSDLVLQAYDIPTKPDADPAHPSQADASLFDECLRLFRPSDLDELVSERNIDGRCGYALCPKSHQKIPGAGIKTWNGKGGKGFKLLTTADLEKWCSDRCGDRAAFVRAQLSSEPAWMRDFQNEVRLLDEVLRTESVDDLTSAIKALAINHTEKVEASSKLQELSRERGEVQMMGVSDQVVVLEKDDRAVKSRSPKLRDVDSIDGHKLKTVRFANEHI